MTLEYTTERFSNTALLWKEIANIQLYTNMFNSDEKFTRTQRSLDLQTLDVKVNINKY